MGLLLRQNLRIFKYKGDSTLVVIGDDNVIRENVVINRATTPEGRTVIGNGNFLHEGVHISHDTILEIMVCLVMAARFPATVSSRIIQSSEVVCWQTRKPCWYMVDDDTDRLPFPQGCASLYVAAPGADNLLRR